MDIILGEWLFATDNLINLLPKCYLKGKLYQVIGINGNRFNVKNEFDESLFYKITLDNYFVKPKENELWT